jgi:hypothetical protein
MNRESASAEAASVMAAPSPKIALHPFVPLQEIPEGVEVTVPVPSSVKSIAN